MTNTDGTAPAEKPARSKKNATATEPANTAPTAETVAAPAAPAPTVVETRPGIGRGILIGAIAAALVGGLALGGGAGALIATAVGHHDRPELSQGPGGQFGPQGQNAPGQGQQAGPGQTAPGLTAPGLPGQPPQGGSGTGQNGQQDGGQQDDGQSDDGQSGSSDDSSTDGSN